LVGKNEKRPAADFHVGGTVPSDGIYRAFHNCHRTSHEVTLLAGEAFPPCVKCGSDVRFEHVREVQRPANDPDFKFQIRLYELPHPVVPDEEERIA
jgi:hypothetical protein